MIDEIRGLEETLKALKQFPINIQNNVMAGAIRAATKPIIKEARANVPEKTKNLKKSIGVVKRKSEDKTKLHFSVTPRKGKKNNGWYGHLIEFGTATQEAQPFMRPAFENQDRQGIEEAKKYLAKRLDKEIEKAKR